MINITLVFTVKKNCSNFCIKKFWLLFFVSSFCFNNFVFSQNKSLYLPDYEFVKIEKNRIDVPGDSAVLDTFFAKIKRFCQTGEGNINVLHIGGSHVQAGILTNQIRNNLDFFNDNSLISRGLIFPFQVAKTNNPSSFSVHYKGEWLVEKNIKRNFAAPLGISGIALIVSDSTAEISINLNPKPDRKRWFMDTLILIGHAYNESVIPVLKLDSAYIWATHNPENHTYTYILPEKIDNFTVIFHQTEKNAAKFILEGFIPKTNSQGIVYHEVGVNGAAVNSYLKCENFEKELALIKPDLVILGIGINDAADVNFKPEKFIENYNALITKIRNVSPDCAFIFITNNDSYRRIRTGRRKYRYEVNQNGLVVEKAFYELASQNNGGVWNQFGIMGGLRSMREWQNAGLAQKDKIHFTARGYTLLGDMFFNAFEEYYQKLEK
jgi:hypothetical protein